jgi:hypothetical protein
VVVEAVIATIDHSRIRGFRDPLERETLDICAPRLVWTDVYEFGAHSSCYVFAALRLACKWAGSDHWARHS